MSDRWMRKDDRTRHDGKTTKPEPVTHLDPVTMLPKRSNVTAEDRVAKIATQGRLSWAEQREESRRLNSILLSRAAVAIDNGTEDADTISTFLRVSENARKGEIEERNADGDDDVPRSREELEELAKKK